MLTQVVAVEPRLVNAQIVLEAQLCCGHIVAVSFHPEFSAANVSAVRVGDELPCSACQDPTRTARMLAAAGLD